MTGTEDSTPKTPPDWNEGEAPKGRAVIVVDWIEAKHVEAPTMGLCEWWGSSWRVTWPGVDEPEWWGDYGEWPSNYQWHELPAFGGAQ